MVKALEEERIRLKEELDDARKSKDDPESVDWNWLTTFDGKIWDKKPKDPPRFVSKAARKARFVSFVNLKGGVGKNDTDGKFKRPLSRKARRFFSWTSTIRTSDDPCLDLKEQRIAREQKKFVEHLLSEGAVGARGFSGWTIPIAKRRGFDLLGTEEPLSDVETKLMVQWFFKGSTNGAEDVRYLLRKLMHSDDVTESSDYAPLLARLD